VRSVLNLTSNAAFATHCTRHTVHGNPLFSISSTLCLSVSLPHPHPPTHTYTGEEEYDEEYRTTEQDQDRSAFNASRVNVGGGGAGGQELQTIPPRMEAEVHEVRGSSGNGGSLPQGRRLDDGPGDREGGGRGSNGRRTRPKPPQSAPPSGWD
jgi:hypothetical protein